MKRAKDYASQFNDDPSTETVHAIANEFFREVDEMKKQRGVTTDSGVISILNEQDRKWRAFARRAADGSIKEDGFVLLVETVHPLVYQAWRGARGAMR